MQKELPLGIEPRLRDLESRVLPLHHRSFAVYLRKIVRYRGDGEYGKCEKWLVNCRGRILES